MSRLLLSLLLATSAVAPATAGAQRTDSSAAPLAGLAEQRVGVLPAQAFVIGDTTIFALPANPTALLVQFDEELSFAVHESSFGARWVDSDALTRVAKRNAVMASDPHRLDAQQLRPAARRSPFAEVVGPLSTDLRALSAIADCRLLLVPAEIRLERTGDAGMRAIARVAIVDTRSSRVIWSGDVSGAAVGKYSPALLASLAQRIIGLVAAPAP